MTIRAVLFDMGGTIETFWQTPQLCQAAVPDLRTLMKVAGVGLPVNDVELYEIISNGWKKYRQWSLSSLRELPVESIWCDHILADQPVNRDLVAASAEKLMVFLELRWYHREMRPEAPEVLESLQRSGLKIGMISNVASRGQVPATLRQYGLETFFNPILLSSTCGLRKPDPAVFHIAARMINEPTSRCLYVGDRISRDILGSQKAGFCKSIQIINYFDHGEEEMDAKPDHVISSLKELLPIINSEITSSEKSPQSSGSYEIKALIFDAGDILYFRPQRGRFFKAFLKKNNVEESRVEKNAKEKLKQLSFQGHISREQLHERLVMLYGISEPNLISSGKEALEADENDICFFEGVSETIKSLKSRGFLLGILTDTANPLSVKLRWFEKGGFGHVWDAIISSHDLGVQKPDAQMYQAVLQQMGVSPHKAIFIGHDQDELRGARDLGMRTVAFNYQENVTADYYISKFIDLTEIPCLAGERQKDVTY